jgi:hypothetical protein
MGNVVVGHYRSTSKRDTPNVRAIFAGFTQHRTMPE